MDTRSLGYKKRHRKDWMVGHKIEGFIPYIRETFPYPIETILLDQAQEGNVYDQPALTIDWTSVVLTRSNQELFKEDIAMIMGTGLIA